MLNCELLRTCPFFNNRSHWVSEMTDADKDRYCKGAYGWWWQVHDLQGIPERTGEAKFSPNNGKGDLK